jgi:ABC-type cobalamin transport system permease subunit
MDETHRQMARIAAALFGAAGLVTLLSILLPHEPEVDVEGLEVVSAGAGILAAIVFLAGARLPGWAVHVWTALGTVLVSLALLFNGERHGGAAGGDEMYTCGSSSM